MEKKKVGIIGGGSAGYLTALGLRKYFPNWDIQIIESSKTPIIGVGEATTPFLLNFLHNFLEFPVDEFFVETKPTLKLGVKFFWGKNEFYNNPFGPIDNLDQACEFGDFSKCSIVSEMMNANKAPLFKSTNQQLSPFKLKRGFAYHIDNKLFVKYLRKKIKSFQIPIIDTEIAEIESENNSVTQLTSSTGSVYQYDLYFDCSGFKSLITGTHLKSKWISYADSLFTDRAILGTKCHKGPISPYTTATTLNAGWLWETPTQAENHLGYVYSSKFISDEDAEKELSKYVDDLSNKKVVSFKTGRYQNSWTGNVIAIGNSFAFIEPLESTGIHMIIDQIRKFYKYYSASEDLKQSREFYNKKVNGSWDFLKTFIALHFKYNYKLNTPFWKHCREDIDLSEIQDYIEFFQEYGPIGKHKQNPLFAKMNKDAIFSAFSFDFNLAGCGMEWKKNNINSNPEEWKKKLKTQNSFVEKMVSHKEMLHFLEYKKTNFIQSWFSKT